MGLDHIISHLELAKGYKNKDLKGQKIARSSLYAYALNQAISGTVPPTDITELLHLFDKSLWPIILHENIVANRLNGKYSDAKDLCHEGLALNLGSMADAQFHIDLADIHRVGDNDHSSAASELLKAKDIAHYKLKNDEVFETDDARFVNAVVAYHTGQLLMSKSQEEPAFAKGIELNFQTAENKTGQLLKKFPNNITYMKNHALACMGLASYFESVDRLSEAYNYSTRSQELYESLKLKRDEYNAVTVLGRIARKQNNPKEALEHFQRAYALVKNSDDRARVSVYVDLAETHLMLNKVPEALSYMDQALEIKDCLSKDDLSRMEPQLTRMNKYYSKLTNSTSGTAEALIKIL